MRKSEPFLRFSTNRVTSEPCACETLDHEPNANVNATMAARRRTEPNISFNCITLGTQLSFLDTQALAALAHLFGRGSMTGCSLEHARGAKGSMSVFWREPPGLATTKL